MKSSLSGGSYRIKQHLSAYPRVGPPTVDAKNETKDSAPEYTTNELDYDMLYRGSDDD